ncbi:helix-turn-helix domain-containing protein [Vibrio sp. 10N]|uniref:helix-turn-helix domain-containing protein n=1 Tax=Vibrio sp. 10N TaxID=3058938 RepID=UPI0028144A70|nr:AraC family transcriptional regulator [Vibrio sp. 10N]
MRASQAISRYFQLCVFFLLLMPQLVVSKELPPVFYPLSLQANGQFLAAKQLFPGVEGGLWSIDVHNRVRFYDGTRFIELDSLSFDDNDVTFFRGQFWYAKANKLFSQRPLGQINQIYTTKLTEHIQSLGHGGEYIWFATGSQVYLGNDHPSKFEVIPMDEFERFYGGVGVEITAAIETRGTWYIGTNVGLYRWQHGELDYVGTVHRGAISTLLLEPYSNRLVIGYQSGVEIYPIDEPTLRTFFPLGQHVLSLESTASHFWIGTEQGLYWLEQDDLTLEQVEFNPHDEFGLAGDKIYALVADGALGMWIATNNGVRYFSEYGKFFERISVSIDENLNRLEPKLEVMDNPLGGYRVITSSALYSVDENGESAMIYWGKVSSLAQRDENLWIATARGLMHLDLDAYQITAMRQTIDNMPAQVEHISLGSGDTLWISDGLRLLSLNVTTERVNDYGDDWVVSEHLPAKVTEIYAMADNRALVGTDHGLYIIDEGRSRYIGDSEPFGSVTELVADEHRIWAASSYGAFLYDDQQKSFKRLELFQDSTRPVCVTQSEGVFWLVSSAGLTAYTRSGDIVSHLGAPYGVISNEFINGSCAYSDQSRLIVIGSRYGIVEFAPERILDNPVPTPSVLVSQVSVNNSARHLGDIQNLMPDVGYGDSVAIQFSLWPSAQGHSLVYRSSDGEWQDMQGFQLNIDKPTPGLHTIEVAVKGDRALDKITTFSYQVRTPWYMTGMFYLLLTISSLLLIGAVIYWRSRRIRFMNRALKTQVALKTEQLQHQSRVLVGNNQQLRKAFKIRQQLIRELVEQAAQHSANFKLESLSNGNPGSVSSFDGLDNVKAIFDEQSSYPLVCSVSSILNFTVEAWRKELDSYGIKVDLKMLASSDNVVLDTCNLDIIFNSIIANALRRMVRGQVISIIVDDDASKLNVTFEDNGLPLPNFNSQNSPQSFDGKESQLDFSPSSLPAHIHRSGGELQPVERGNINRLTLRWMLSIQPSQSGSPSTPVQRSQDVDRQLVSLVTEKEMPDVKPDKHEQWKRQVTQLVAEQYHDAELSTASAAKALFISERSFQRRFKSQFDCTFTDYLTDVRMEKACEMLLQGEKVSEVAFACGFNDPSYFSQRFKVYFGVPPSKFAMMDMSDSD